MGLFDDMLKDNESLFLDPLPLDIDFIPPVIEGRENEQQYISTAIKPLFHKRAGKNLLITGVPGIGKTVAAKYVMGELNKETDDIKTIYINCWKKDSPYKIALEMCDQLGFKFIHNKDTTDLFKEVSKILNKKSAVIVLDECDKISDQQLFYTLIEEIYRKTLILITNNEQWLSKIDNRIKSRLTPELLTFEPYSYDETKNILQKRVQFAFVPNVIYDEDFEKIVEKTFEAKDIRVGLYLLKEAGEIAEHNSSRKIIKDHVEKAVKKLKDFQIKSTSTLDSAEKEILDIIKENSGKKVKEIYDIFIKKGRKHSYSTFHRKVKNLEKGKFISLEEINEGPGKAAIARYGDKKLTDF